MKKIIAILVALMMVAGLVACSTSTTDTDEESLEGLSIVTTIFPIYDWVREVMGDEVDNHTLTMLMGTGVDLHSYEPTTEDLVTIYEADVFIYNGGESDEWVDDVLDNATNPDMVVINLLEVLGDDALTEVSVEGMQEEDEEEDHDHDDEEETDEDDHDHDDEEETDEDDHDDEDTDEDEEEHEHNHEDEHIWLSLNNAQTLTAYLAQELGVIDADNADTYTQNQATYAASLASLDAEYEEVVTNAAFDTILFADRFPFRYLTEDYGITYYAAFSGCSSETEASFETITFLAEKVDELGLTTVLIIDGATTEIADTVIASTATADQEILVLDSMQSITSTTADETSYLEIMQSNLEVLESALN